MISKNKKRFIRHQFTVIELLVVLALVGVITGISVSGIRGVLAKQGATGAVRTLATKISLAQSFAVSKNRCVALLMPDYYRLSQNSSDTLGYTSGDEFTKYRVSNNTTFNNRSYAFTRNRMCYVEQDPNTNEYKFVSWIPGYEWQKLPSKTVAFITQSVGPGLDEKFKSTPKKVTQIDDPTDPGNEQDCTAIIFKPSGALVNADQVIINVMYALYAPDKADDKFTWQGKRGSTETDVQFNERKKRGDWAIRINGFTGRAKFMLRRELIND